MWFQGYLARATGKVKLPLTEVKTALEVAILGWGRGVCGERVCGEQMCGFGHVAFEMSIGHPDGGMNSKHCEQPWVNTEVLKVREMEM